MNEMNIASQFLFYGDNKVPVMVKGESVWASQKNLSEIFGVDRTVITKHLQNIFESGELDKDSVSAKIAHTAQDGKSYQTLFYNLDAMLSVGYRVSSYEATRFRIWATSVLKDYLIKGFALDDERLKQGTILFGKDYFKELLERIREIRASERRFYQKITDIYKACSIDYDKSSPITQNFYATVQNKLHYAITKKTAAEIIKDRANSISPNMGLQTWKNAPEGKVLKSDAVVAKNYLLQEEIKQLNRLVSMYLDYAENQAERQIAMKMAEWAKKLDAFLTFNEYDLLKDAGKVSAQIALAIAEKEYGKFRVIQDENYISDFDIIAGEIKETGTIPQKIEKPSFSNFNKSLKRALNFNPKENEATPE